MLIDADGWKWLPHLYESSCRIFISTCPLCQWCQKITSAYGSVTPSNLGISFSNPQLEYESLTPLAPLFPPLDQQVTVLVQVQSHHRYGLRVAPLLGLFAGSPSEHLMYGGTGSGNKTITAANRFGVFRL
jgi:hypothetical protein